MAKIQISYHYGPSRKELRIETTDLVAEKRLPEDLALAQGYYEQITNTFAKMLSFLNNTAGKRVIAGKLEIDVEDIPEKS